MVKLWEVLAPLGIPPPQPTLGEINDEAAKLAVKGSRFEFCFKAGRVHFGTPRGC
jgi:hypothetical protein